MRLQEPVKRAASPPQGRRLSVFLVACGGESFDAGLMELTHLDEHGQPGMVDIGGKTPTLRTARAQALVHLPKEVMDAFAGEDFESKKGPVLQTARLAGTMAVKRTADLIPLCHPLPIEKIRFAMRLERARNQIQIECEVKALYKTGVEMEALTGASVAALTVYDMCKALSPAIEIGEIRLLEKTGGKRDYSAGSAGGTAAG